MEVLLQGIITDFSLGTRALLCPQEELHVLNMRTLCVKDKLFLFWFYIRHIASITVNKAFFCLLVF